MQNSAILKVGYPYTYISLIAIDTYFINSSVSVGLIKANIIHYRVCLHIQFSIRLSIFYTAGPHDDTCNSSCRYYVLITDTIFDTLP